MLWDTLTSEEQEALTERQLQAEQAMLMGGKDKYFSAECWATGSALADLRPGVPIGLLSAAMGGSMIQSWMSPEAMAACPSATMTSRSG